MTGRLIDARLGELRPHPQNYNRHSEAQVKRLAQSLETFGQPKPIVIWRGLIIAGHGLAEAAQRLKWETLLASDMSEEWTEAQATAFVGADNELARLADPDEAALAALAASLADVDRELAALAAGSEERLRELLATLEAPAGEDPGAQVDKAAELQAKWGTATGQLWQLGEHRLVCGDCTDREVVARVMDGERAALLWADPPFGISYTGHGASKDGRANKFSPIAGDDAPDPSWLPLWLPQHGAVYLKTTWQVLYDWERAMIAICDLRAHIVWDRCSHSAGEVIGGYATQTEIILFGSVGEHKTNKFDTDLWSIPRATTGAPEQRTGHPYESPVALPQRGIKNSSQNGGIVADPFLGSGTTLIACEQLGRRCRAVEISPAYVGVCLERWHVMTGKTPVLIEKGHEA